MTDTELTYISQTVGHPLVNATIHSNSTINEIGNSAAIFVGNAKHIDVLIKLGAETGVATIQYFVDVIESSSGATIRTYNGTELTAADSADYITVDNTTLGTYIKIRWTAGGGTLNGDNYFAGVYSRIIAKV